MHPFIEYFDRKHKTIRLTPLPNQGAYNWTAVTERLKQKMAEGILNWDLDLGRMMQIDSHAAGAFIVYSMTVSQAGGTFRLIVNRGTPAFETLQFYKLHMLIQVIGRGATV